ncbi:MAG: light-harvesting protein [Pseudomonadota bacterium]
MINSKMWLVVQPTIGIPLFLGGVAVGSFAVHLAIVSNTSWVGDFLSGKEMGSSKHASIEAPIQPASLPLAEAKVYPTSSDEMIVVLPDGRMGKAVLKTPLALGSTSSTN